MMPILGPNYPYIALLKGGGGGVEGAPTLGEPMVYNSRQAMPIPSDPSDQQGRI